MTQGYGGRSHFYENFRSLGGNYSTNCFFGEFICDFLTIPARPLPHIPVRNRTSNHVLFLSKKLKINSLNNPA
jgi:hypothetical protein